MSAASPHEEEVLGKAYDARLARRLLRYVRPYRGSLIAGVVLILLGSLFQLMGPALTAAALDISIAPRPGSGSSFIGRAAAAVASRLHVSLAGRAGVDFFAAAFLASLLLSFVLTYAQVWIVNWMGQRIMYDLRAEIFENLQRADVGYLDRHPVGRLMTRLTSDVDALNELFTSGIVAMVGDVFTLAGIVAALFLLNPLLALVTFLTLPLIIAFTAWFRKRSRETYRDIRVRLARINAFLQEHITGMPVVQLFNREERARRDFSVINDAHRQAYIRAIFYYSVFYPGVELLSALGLALIIGVGGSGVIRGAISIGVLVAFIQYAQRFFRPIADLSDKYNILQAAMASSERIFRLLDTPAAIASPAAPVRPPREGRLAMERVWFAYARGEEVLKDVSIEAGPGERLALVGHTGAGKTTIASLFLRFYDAGVGVVRVDGEDVRRFDLADLRSRFAIVLQDPFLFTSSISDNIRLGNRAITDAQVRRAAEEARAAGFIERLPRGYDTVLQERGGGLSAGQKQLISIARAFAFDPEFLILDEATANIDTETEMEIRDGLARLLARRTSLVIAHRLSTIRQASRIVVLHKGEVREVGTHAELLDRGGLYAKLYRLQYRDQELLARSAG
ncbi:MAG TPA: ABC transporter ATP-binding protein [Thermoanaerobaculia bacterium]|nr:ABC transporter ATP-binding protein [Thermoanaerobaculia bacterium]